MFNKIFALSAVLSVTFQTMPVLTQTFASGNAQLSSNTRLDFIPPLSEPWNLTIENYHHDAHSYRHPYMEYDRTISFIQEFILDEWKDVSTHHTTKSLPPPQKRTTHSMKHPQTFFHEKKTFDNYEPWPHTYHMAGVPNLDRFRVITSTDPENERSMKNILWAYHWGYLHMFVELWKDKGWVPTFNFSFHQQVGLPHWPVYTVTLTQEGIRGAAEVS